MVDIAENDRDVQKMLNQVGAALDILSRHGIRPEQAIEMAKARKEERGIPLSIFNPDLGALESIVKYMREELLLDYRTIAQILHRNEGPIGVTYRRSRRKLTGKLDVLSRETIPFDIFKNRKLSVFENIAYYLAKQGNDWHKIARLLHRHDKTVWTILDRAKKKMRMR
jgi:hypothetical protein